MSISISSMTAFASCHGQYKVSHDDSVSPVDWIWEIRSVNARGLDLRLRLPREFESIEPIIRKKIEKYCKRGTITISLIMNQTSNQDMLCLDEDMLKQLIAITSEWQKRFSDFVSLPRLDGLFSLPGVLVPCGKKNQKINLQECNTSVLLSLEGAIDSLVSMRMEEGRNLAAVMNTNLDIIESLIKMAYARAEAQSTMILTRLRDLIEKILQKTPPLSEERLIQEAAILAGRADIREELDRLGAHAVAIRQLLTTGGVVGRRIDFLCQELNREANTLSTKAKILDLTYIGIDLKTTIDQLREQVQNLE